MKSEKQEPCKNSFGLGSSKIFALATTLSALSIAQLHAHEVWIETLPEGSVIARFAEYGEEPETSPGYLDDLDAVVAWTAGENGESELLEVTKKHDHFGLGKATPVNPVLLETGFRVMESRGDRPPRKPYFYARRQATLNESAQPALTLDIVPTGEPGVLRMYFRNKPLANVEVTLFAPNAENDQDLTSDAEGYIRFNVKDKGLYMIKCARYREEREGFSAGSVFGLVSHNMSLTWRQK